jgi:hypothetical protein
MEGIVTKNHLEADQYFGDLQTLMNRRAPSVQFAALYWPKGTTQNQ